MYAILPKSIFNTFCPVKSAQLFQSSVCYTLPMACLVFKYLFSIYEHCYDVDIKRYLLLSNLSLAISMSHKVYKVSGMNNLMKNFYILGYFSRKHQLFERSHLNLNNTLYSNFPSAFVYIYIYTHTYMYTRAKLNKSTSQKS